MLSDPIRQAVILRYVSRTIWLIMAWAAGSLVGHLILLAR
jgi:hypothetical protein